MFLAQVKTPEPGAVHRANGVHRLNILITPLCMSPQDQAQDTPAEMLQADQYGGQITPMYVNTEGSPGDTPRDSEWGKMEEGEIPTAGKAGKRAYRKAKTVRLLEVVEKKEKRKYTPVRRLVRRTELVSKKLILRLKKRCKKRTDGKEKESGSIVKELNTVEEKSYCSQEEQLKELLQSDSDSDQIGD